MKTKNIMIVGVGGQGTLLTSRILGGIAMQAGYDVKLSEVHGMAQRGGSVVTFVRYGESVAEPIVEEGCADVIIAFATFKSSAVISVSFTLATVPFEQAVRERTATIPKAIANFFLNRISLQKKMA